MSLATQVLTGLALGIVAGLFLGDLIAPVGLMGDAFILLLQMTVLPYVAFSLIRGLGSLEYAEAISLARTAGGLLVVLWLVYLAVILLVPLSFPRWPAASFFSTSLVQPAEPLDFLQLFIPANPFAALSENVVPSVVVFSIALGVALIGLERRGALLETLSALVDALGRITTFVIRLAPLGVFAIVAHGMGTMDLEQLSRLQVYVAAHTVAALLLVLWILPGLVMTLTPFRYRDVLGTTRDALVTAFATGNLFVVLAVLAERSKQLVALRTDASDESESLVEIVVPTAFTLPSGGKLLTLAFVLFGGWLSGYALSYAQYPALAVSGLFSLFGSTVVAIPYLLDLFRVPSDTFSLFLIADNVTGNRFGALLAAVHILTLTLLSACGVAGLLRIRWAALLSYGAVSIAITLAAFLALRFGFEAMGHQYTGYTRLVQMKLLGEAAPAKILAGPPATPPRSDRGEPTLKRIQKRGLLRVGYRHDALPFAFRNESGDLVGFDVEMAHALARELGVRLELVQVDLKEIPGLLETGYLDVVMTGLAVTTDRLERMSFSASYLEGTLAFVVPDHLRDEFSSRSAVQALRSLRIGVPQASYYLEKVRNYLPRAEVVPLDSPRDFFRDEGRFDALVVTAETGAAWCLIYPQFSVAVPQPDILRVPFAYPVAPGEFDMVRFLSAWIDLKRKDGTIDRVFNYWIEGRSEEQLEPRWSVIRDVLGWVD